MRNRSRKGKFDEVFRNFVITEDILLMEGREVSEDDAMQCISAIQGSAAWKGFLGVFKFAAWAGKKILSPEKGSLIERMYNFISGDTIMKLIGKGKVRKYIYIIKRTFFEKIWPKLKEISIVKWIMSIVDGFKGGNFSGAWKAIVDGFKSLKAKNIKGILSTLASDASKLLSAMDWIFKLVKTVSGFIAYVKDECGAVIEDIKWVFTGKAKDALANA